MSVCLCVYVCCVCVVPVLLLVVQQSLDLPGPPLSLVLLFLQGSPPGIPLPLLLQQLIVQGLQLQDLLLQHGARGLQRLNVLTQDTGGRLNENRRIEGTALLCSYRQHEQHRPIAGEKRTLIQPFKELFMVFCGLNEAAL